MKKYTSEMLERALALHAEGLTSSTIAGIIKKEFGLEAKEDSVRRRIDEKMKEALEGHGFTEKDVTGGWIKGDGFSLRVKKGADDLVTWEEVREEMISELKAVKKPKFDFSHPEPSKDGHLLVLDPADVHVGKLSDVFETGEEYDSKLAVKRCLEGVRGILQKASGFDIEQIVFVGGNDILHIDSPRRTTTSGTPQDTDQMWFRNFMIAKRLYIDIIGSLLSIAPVHFVFNPSNHDYTHGFFLADMITTYFENASGFTHDTDLRHRKYYLYGSSLIATTHGDGAKTADLPMLMATEEPNLWSKSIHRYVYTHHLHHKVAKDYHGVCVETLRSPSGADSWHHRNGYQHAPKAVEGYVHHIKHGQVARLTHLF